MMNEEEARGLTLKDLVLELRKDVRTIMEMLVTKASHADLQIVDAKVDVVHNQMTELRAQQPQSEQVLKEFRKMQVQVEDLIIWKAQSATIDDLREQVAIADRWRIGLVVTIVLSVVGFALRFWGV